MACDYVNGTGLFATPPLLKALGVKEVSINNQHTGKYASIIEVGATGNTMEQCILSMQCLSNVLAEVCK